MLSLTRLLWGVQVNEPWWSIWGQFSMAANVLLMKLLLDGDVIIIIL